MGGQAELSSLPISAEYTQFTNQYLFLIAGGMDPDAQEVLQDPQIQRFVHAMQQEAKFNEKVYELTDQCWDVCSSGAPSNKTDKKTENCYVNCVERCIDASNFIVNRLEKEGQKMLAEKPKSGGDSFVGGNDFGSDSSSSGTSDYASQGFKWN